MHIQNPRWKNSDPGSGINIPDPQHCFIVTRLNDARMYFQTNVAKLLQSQLLEENSPSPQQIST